MSTIIPTTIVALAILVFFFMPGLVTLAVIDRFRVRGRMADSTRLLKAFMYSVAYYAFYLIIGRVWINAAHTLVDDWTKLGGWPYWFLVLMALIVLPFIFGLLGCLFANWARDQDKMKWLFPKGHEDTAWQTAFCGKECRYVKVHLKDGNVVAGFFGMRSAASIDSEEGGLYFEQTFDVQPDETWQLRAQHGAYFSAGEIAYVEFFEGQRKAGGVDNAR
jgi:hypothetical protein